ncbi:hypothetical protein B488_10410 [Liberibacter crescens BT-1]|uniref:PAS domain-containing protein n=1 Tax=Liberibacter crescens (strain BT-1) TaxID=1215343 RepID=L0EWN0_LIBCB|nr:PAS domain-containing protein [Liberibacter crescens]AGA65033.1 hypothetical protein B488_10410 [Liberibacter crescens BT-1]
MRLKTSKKVFDYWNKLRGDESVLLQKLIKLAPISHFLSNLFILEIIDSKFHFRLAGTEICMIFENELNGKFFSEIWDNVFKKKSEMLAQDVMKKLKSLIIYASSQTIYKQLLEVEVVLMPLCSGDVGCDRILGCLSIDGKEFRYIASPIEILKINHFTIIDDTKIENSSLEEKAFDFYTSSSVEDSWFGYYRKKMLHFKVFNGDKKEY